MRKLRVLYWKSKSIVADQVEGDYKLFLFGSRANGKSMERSDIDIAIMTNEKMDASILAKIREEIQKKNLNNSYLSPLDPYLSWKRNLSYRQN